MFKEEVRRATKTLAPTYYAVTNPSVRCTRTVLTTSLSPRIIEAIVAPLDGAQDKRQRAGRPAPHPAAGRRTTAGGLGLSPRAGAESGGTDVDVVPPAAGTPCSRASGRPRLSKWLVQSHASRVQEQVHSEAHLPPKHSPRLLPAIRFRNAAFVSDRNIPSSPLAVGPATQYHATVDFWE